MSKGTTMLPATVHHEFKDEAPVLSVRHLAKRFGAGCDYCRDPHVQLERNICPVCGTVHAVRDISLEVHRGEILGIVGESGSGKSTLMQCLYFDQEPTAGDMRVAAYDEAGATALTFRVSKNALSATRSSAWSTKIPTWACAWNFLEPFQYRREADRCRYPRRFLHGRSRSRAARSREHPLAA